MRIHKKTRVVNRLTGEVLATFEDEGPPHARMNVVRSHLAQLNHYGRLYRGQGYILRFDTDTTEG